LDLLNLSKKRDTSFVVSRYFFVSNTINEDYNDNNSDKIEFIFLENQ